MVTKTMNGSHIHGLSKNQLADVIDLLSNQVGVALTPEGIRELAAIEGDPEPPTEPSVFKHHRLETRLGRDGVATIVSRYEEGESATAIAKDLSVAPSALLRLLVSKQVVIRKHGLTPEQDAMLAKEYEAGATMAELEKKHQLSHGAVSRALHRGGAKMRAAGRPTKPQSLSR